MYNCVYCESSKYVVMANDIDFPYTRRMYFLTAKCKSSDMTLCYAHGVVSYSLTYATYLLFPIRIELSTLAWPVKNIGLCVKRFYAFYDLVLTP